MRVGSRRTIIEIGGRFPQPRDFERLQDKCVPCEHTVVTEERMPSVHREVFLAGGKVIRDVKFRPQPVRNRAGGHEIPKSSLPEFRDTIHFRELKRFVFDPSLTDFTPVGETLGVVNLCEMFSSVGQKCRVQQSRLVNLDEIKGDNAILLGGNQAWRAASFRNVEGFHFQSGVILNGKPQPGEQAVYKPEFDSLTNQLTRDYAVVLILPNETKERRVLLIYGIYTQGSQAAIEYLTNPERMTELRKSLLDLVPDHKTIPSYFQLLLTTTVENAVPGKSSLVAVRIIPG